jgi:hypothetical protein
MSYDKNVINGDAELKVSLKAAGRTSVRIVDYGVVASYPWVAVVEAAIHWRKHARVMPGRSRITDV